MHSTIKVYGKFSLFISQYLFLSRFLNTRTHIQPLHSINHNGLWKRNSSIMNLQIAEVRRSWLTGNENAFTSGDIHKMLEATIVWKYKRAEFCILEQVIVHNDLFLKLNLFPHRIFTTVAVMLGWCRFLYCSWCFGGKGIKKMGWAKKMMDYFWLYHLYDKLKYSIFAKEIKLFS